MSVKGGPDGTKPLPKPVLISPYVRLCGIHLCAISHQADILYCEFESYTLKMTASSPKGQWINLDILCIGGHFKNAYKLLNLRALKFSLVNKIHIFQFMGKIFCVEFQRNYLHIERCNFYTKLKF